MIVSEMWKKWRRERAQAREFDTLDAEQREELARDTGVASNTLRTLASRPPDRGRELQRLMAVLSLDTARIMHSYPAVCRDMGIVCSECLAQNRCRRHLDNGTAHEAYEAYCPNTLTLNTLRREQMSSA